MSDCSEQELEIAGRKIGSEHLPFVIAEVGINHEGEFDKAVQMVDAARAADADFVEFEFFTKRKASSVDE